MDKITLQLLLLLLVFITACDNTPIFTDPGGTVQDEPETETETETEPEPEPEPETELIGPNDFEIPLYFFHTNTRTFGGEISFIENYYEKASGNGPFHSVTTRHLNTGESIESISPDNVVILKFTITNNSIRETGVSYDGGRQSFRYVEVGEKILDAVVEELGTRDTCTLQNHLDEFDLGTATGAATIATGVHEDVLHVFCNRVLDEQIGDTRSNYSWNAYYAKGVGLIFADGNWVVLDEDNNWVPLGDAYLVPEY